MNKIIFSLLIGMVAILGTQVYTTRECVTELYDRCVYLEQANKTLAGELINHKEKINNLQQFVWVNELERAGGHND